MIQFANIDVSQKSETLAAICDRWWDANAPALWTYPGYMTAGLNHLPVPYPPTRERARLNTLIWPTGASRWSVFHAIIGDLQAAQIESAVGPASPTSKTLIMSDDVTGVTITPQMFMLSLRPIFTLGAAGRQLWWLTLVDRRYYWWQKALGEIALSQGDSWASFIGRLFTAANESPIQAAVNAAYGTPSFARWSQLKGVPLPLLMDAAVTTVGQRVVMGLDGTVNTVLPNTAITNDLNQYNTFKPHASFGGRLAVGDMCGNIPASVVVGYWSVGKVAVSNTTVSLGNLVTVASAAIASGGTGYVNGNVLTIPGGSPAGTITVNTVNVSGVITSATVTQSGVFAGAFTNPVAVTGGAGSGATFNLTTAATTMPGYGVITGVPNTSIWIQGDVKAGTSKSYAVQAANDWYQWRLSLTDVTLRSIQFWPPTGLEDRIEWEYAPGEWSWSKGDEFSTDVRLPRQRSLTRVVPAHWADKSIYGNRAPRGIAFEVELTSTFNVSTGYSWKRLRLDTSSGSPGFVDPETPTIGNLAFSSDGSQDFTPPQRVWLEPSPDEMGWVFSVGAGSGWQRALPSGCCPPTDPPLIIGMPCGSGSGSGSGSGPCCSIIGICNQRLTSDTTGQGPGVVSTNYIDFYSSCLKGLGTGGVYLTQAQINTLATNCGASLTVVLPPSCEGIPVDIAYQGGALAGPGILCVTVTGQTGSYAGMSSQAQSVITSKGYPVSATSADGTATISGNLVYCGTGLYFVGVASSTKGFGTGAYSCGCSVTYQSCGSIVLGNGQGVATESYSKVGNLRSIQIVTPCGNFKIDTIPGPCGTGPHGGPCGFGPSTVLNLTVSGSAQWGNGTYVSSYNAVSGLWEFTVTGNTNNPLAFGYTPNAGGQYILGFATGGVPWPAGNYGPYSCGPFSETGLTVGAFITPGSGNMTITGP